MRERRIQPGSESRPNEVKRKLGIPAAARSLFEMGSELPPAPKVEQEILDRKGEAKRVLKRLAAIIEDHRQASLVMGIEFAPSDITAVVEGLRRHADGKKGLPIEGACDEIHGYCLNRLFEELVEEPSNILFTTQTGPDSVRYDAMNAEFWLECIELLNKIYGDPKK